MLFVIDKSLIDALKLDNNDKADIVDALENIARARREGKHLIFASRNNLKVLKEYPLLSDTARRVFNKLYNQLPQMDVYRQHFIRRVEIVAEDVFEIFSEGNHKVIRISAKNLRDFSFVMDSVLLAENQDDIKFYKKLTQTYLHWSGLGHIKISCESRGGGGQNTVNEFKEIIDQKNRLCLCIVDSDRKFPNSNLGSTASSVQKIVDENQSPLAELFILDQRELENILPTRLLEETVNNDPNRMNGVLFLEELEKSNFSDARHYLDIKKGLKLGKVLNQPNGSLFANYWTQVANCMQNKAFNISQKCRTNHNCHDETGCTCIVAVGLGDSILTDVITTLERNSSQKIGEMVREPLKTTWGHIGEILIAWCCGGSRLVTI